MWPLTDSGGLHYAVRELNTAGGAFAEKAPRTSCGPTLIT